MGQDSFQQYLGIPDPLIGNELEQQTSSLLATVVVAGLPLGLTYSIPQSLEGQITVGCQVEVEVRHRKAIGWVSEIKPLDADNSARERSTKRNVSYQTKEILRSTPIFPTSQLPLYEWLSSYYACSLAEAIANAVPQIVQPKKRKGMGQKSNTNFPSSESSNDIDLTIAQNEACGKIFPSIEQREYQPFLLYGVTGSGKTEVYLRAIRHTLKTGRGALIIVPEIALTPQLLQHFENRLGESVALLHSMMSRGLRWMAWKSLLEGEVRVAVGARSAVFAPIDQLGLIIVDEEHDASFKQSDSLRYNARDTAVVRAKLSQCPVILGSATPSFESLHNVKSGRYKILELPERVANRPLPQIELIDLSKIKAKQMASANVSPELYEALAEALAAQQQSIILYNRRGFSSFLQCNSCQESLRCPNCAVTLTYHKKRNRLVCHYCDFNIKPPLFCPSCRDPKFSRTEKDAENSVSTGQLSFRGSGTEGIEEEIQGLFPEARLLRMDRDTVQQCKHYEQILQDMREHKADILIGTQMIAKGHDLPQVTCVGVIDADVGLHFPDFRANERAFQLITQAAGRAGRGDNPGRVLVQTRQPSHPAILAVQAGRFKAFARYELEFRKQLFYPPCSRMLRVIISSPNLNDAEQSARELKLSIVEISSRISQISNQLLKTEKTTAQSEDTQPSNLRIEILGPSAAPLERLRNRYRYHILIKAESAKFISQLAKEIDIIKRKKSAKLSLRISLDIDPVDML